MQLIIECNNKCKNTENTKRAAEIIKIETRYYLLINIQATPSNITFETAQRRNVYEKSQFPILANNVSHFCFSRNII